MDPKAFFKISYGVFILGSSCEGKVNACVTNTCIQIAANPIRIAISVLNKNYTCQMIKKSGTFALSILDGSCTFDTIKRFGFASGIDTDKFKDFPYATDIYGNPYLEQETCAEISAKVISFQDLGTHTLFMAEATDTKILSDLEPITYSDYQNHIKPKIYTSHSKKIIGWKCRICGFVYNGAELPADYMCPICSHPAEDFEPIYEM